MGDMVRYEYRCQGCQRIVRADVNFDHLAGTDCCGTIAKRVWGFSQARMMHEHFNHSLGAPVSDMRQFREGLKRKSEIVSERTGIPHNFQPADITDRKALGVTDEGIDKG